MFWLLLAGTGVFLIWRYAVTSYPLQSYAVPYGDLFNEAEKRHGLPPFLLVEVARQESGFNPKAYNAASGASGIMQIVPKWHPGVDPYEPTQAIPYAAGYLRNLKNRTGTWKRALAAYNWGIGNLTTLGFDKMPRETREYIAAISAKLPYGLG